jgi:hypothetical protein
MARKFTHEEAAAMMLAAGLVPLEQYRNSKQPWQCECQTCKSIVAPAFSSIQSGQGGCRSCAIREQAAKRKMNDQEASIVMLEHGLEPLEAYPGNQKKWRCKCASCGNEVMVLRNTVATNGTGCKYCWEQRRGQALRISDSAAIAVMRAAGLEPQDPYVRSGDPWRCIHLECGREVFPSYNSVQQGGGGCQQCGYLKTGAAIRHDHDFAAEILRNAGLEPLENYPGSHSKWRCIHLECGEEVHVQLHAIRGGEGGCFKCGAKKRGIASRLDPEIARQFMIANGLDPQEPYELSNKPWACIHIDCGTLVYPTYASIQGGQKGCRKCADKLTAIRFSYTPEFACEQAISRGYEPLENYPGAMSYWRCRHVPCGKEVKVTLNTLMSGKGCCMDCGVASRAEKNRYTAEEAIAVMRKFDLEPLEEFPGYLEKWRCTHNACGREITTTFWYVKFRESGCKYCSTKGLDYTAEGIVYLLERQDYFSAKVGITTPNSKTDRIAAHVREGWQLVSTWKTPTATEAEVVEDRTLKWWREVLDAPVSMRQEDMKSGWTETASLLYVSIEDTANYIDRLIFELDTQLMGD